MYLFGIYRRPVTVHIWSSPFILSIIAKLIFLVLKTAFILNVYGTYRSWVSRIKARLFGKILGGFHFTIFWQKNFFFSTYFHLSSLFGRIDKDKGSLELIHYCQSSPRRSPKFLPENIFQNIQQQKKNFLMFVLNQKFSLTERKF